jgi:hypothetical protein
MTEELLGKSKQELVDAISEIAGLGSNFKLGVGSSIPSSFFTALQSKFNSPRTTGMENIAAVICIENGIDWTAECDSATSPSGGGGTVTKKGLQQLYQAVKIATSTQETAPLN